METRAEWGGGGCKTKGGKGSDKITGFLHRCLHTILSPRELETAFNLAPRRLIATWG